MNLKNFYRIYPLQKRTYFILRNPEEKKINVFVFSFMQRAKTSNNKTTTVVAHPSPPPDMHAKKKKSRANSSLITTTRSLTHPLPSSSSDVLLLAFLLGKYKF